MVGDCLINESYKVRYQHVKEAKSNTCIYNARVTLYSHLSIAKLVDFNHPTKY